MKIDLTGKLLSIKYISTYVENNVEKVKMMRESSIEYLQDEIIINAISKTDNKTKIVIIAKNKVFKISIEDQE